MTGRERRGLRLSWAGRHELGLLVGILLSAASLWAFAELAGKVTAGATRRLDEAILLAMRVPGDTSEPVGPAWLEELSQDITSLGSTGVLLLLTLASGSYLALQRKFRAMLYVLAAVGGGFLWSVALKAFFERPRPDLISHEVDVHFMSFPSGHSMSAAVTYLTLGALIARVESRFRLKAFLILMAALVTILVGLTRVYLGVHWPTDVLAGWTAGAAWAVLCWTIALWLQRRGKVEQAPPDPEHPGTEPPPSARPGPEAVEAS